MADKKVTKTINDDGSLTFEFATGETETVNPGDFSNEIQKQLLIHGTSQKLGDSYSGEDADKCFTIFSGVLTNLTDGNWSARAGGGGGARISQLAEALSRASDGETVETCVMTLSAMSDEEKAAVKKHPAVQAAIAELKLEKAQAEAKKLKAELGKDIPAFKLPAAA